jgi:hypothetical protein
VALFDRATAKSALGGHVPVLFENTRPARLSTALPLAPARVAELLDT